MSMIPAPKQKGLDYSILQQKIGSKTYKALCSSVIYGPNASGKSNIIGAMDTFKTILLRGNIRNSEKRESLNYAASSLELIPNREDGDAPVEFSIRLIEAGLLIDYGFAMEIGAFLERDAPRRVHSETLRINGELIFERRDHLAFGDFRVIHDYRVHEFEQNRSSLVSLAEANLMEDELFLMNGFKNLISARLVRVIQQWIQDRLIIIYHADAMRLSPKLPGNEKDSIYVDESLNEAMDCFGTNASGFGYIIRENTPNAQLVSMIQKGDGKEEKDLILPIDLFESYGTIRFLHLFPLILNAIQTGGTLVVDELDASIHPMAIMSIINVFHNDEINQKKAQLIFNTHNPIFLNANLFRRDEIKFVERDESSHVSTLYSLSDFGTSGSQGVRKQEDYLRNYFVDHYGAIKNVDFSDIFLKRMDQKKQGEEDDQEGKA